MGSIQSRAESPSLETLLKACDNALTKERAAGQAEQLLNQHLTKAVELRDQRITELERRQDGTETSKVIWFGLGLLTTGVVFHLVK